MTLKAKMSLLVFLTSLSIVSIGFSSWSITVETNAEAIGNIEVDNVINNNNMITQETVHEFTYSELGFTNSKNLLTKTGEIIVDYTINLKNCKEFLAENSLSVNLTMKYQAESGTFNLFKDSGNASEYNKLNISYSTDGNIWNSILDSQITDYQCLSIINFDKVLDSNYGSDTLSFSIKYSFEVTSGLYFNNNFYSVLELEGFEFLLTASLTDYEYVEGGE